MDGRERGAKLVELIYKERELRAEQKRSNRVGPSSAGTQCLRSLWYKFRWADDFQPADGRLLRLFESGDLAEGRFVEELRWLGAEVHDKDPDDPTGQIRIEREDGHCVGYLDGIAFDVPHSNSECVVVEFKTSAQTKWKELNRKGVQDAQPTHYAQMQIYMDAVCAPEALYLSVNKNTDEIYAEFVPLVPGAVDELHSRIEIAIHATEAPERISKNPDFFVCKMCPARAVCHEGAVPPASCRTCKHSTPMSCEGEKANHFWCELREKKLLLKDQQLGCEHWTLSPAFEPEQE